MRRERQIEVLQQIEAADISLVSDPWPLAEASMRRPSAVYTDPERFQEELRILFRRGPVLVALSCELAAPGAHLTADLGGVPALIVRQADGSLRGFVNMCRHRGAPLAEGCGTARGSFVCPYHAWTFGLDGELRARPWAEPAFDDIPKEELSLLPIAVAEAHGFVFAQAEGGKNLTVSGALGAGKAEFAEYGMETYHHFESRTVERNMNWKLLLDTFLENYHIRTLHKNTIAADYLSNASVFEPLGPHLRFMGLLRSILPELEKEKEGRALMKHGTCQYIIAPNVLFSYQRDHIELWRVTPLGVDRARAVVSLFTAEEPETESQIRYFRKSLDLLLKVTGEEDFPLMEKIHANLASGALPEIIFGRNEPALIHFHKAIDAMLAAGA